jgi:hypothetical protein
VAAVEAVVAVAGLAALEVAAVWQHGGGGSGSSAAAALRWRAVRGRGQQRRGSVVAVAATVWRW